MKTATTLNVYIPTSEEVIAEAKAHYVGEPKYEKAYCFGWLQSQYNRVADELREIKNKGKVIR